jgi:hypothetical protein
MNVKELHTLITDALQRGLDPRTTVVIADQGWYRIVESVSNPQDNEDLDCWLTLFPGQEADSRFTPAHEYGYPVHDLDPVYHDPATGEPVQL